MTSFPTTGCESRSVIYSISSTTKSSGDQGAVGVTQESLGKRRNVGSEPVRCIGMGLALLLSTVRMETSTLVGPWEVVKNSRWHLRTNPTVLGLILDHLRSPQLWSKEI